MDPGENPCERMISFWKLGNTMLYGEVKVQAPKAEQWIVWEKVNGSSRSLGFALTLGAWRVLLS